MADTLLPPGLRRARIQEIVDAIRFKLRRTVALINGKGGTGKTTSASNLAGAIAAALVEVKSSKRVLLIQLDKQGDIGLDLGTKGKPGDDNGASIAHVVMGTGKLNVVRDVRPQLDLVPGGSHVKEAASVIIGKSGSEKKLARLRFAEALADLAAEYEWILIDCPPGDEELQNLGLGAARWALIPAAFDKSSRWGLEGVAEGFEETEDINPDLELLGVLMFAFSRGDVRRIKDENGEVVGYREIGQRARARKRLEADLAGIGSDAPVFKTVIGYARVVAEECRERGRLAYEMADASAGPGWRKISRQRGVTFKSETAEALAVDFEDAAIEIFGRAKELEVEDAA